MKWAPLQMLRMVHDRIFQPMVSGEGGLSEHSDLKMSNEAMTFHVAIIPGIQAK